MMDASNTSFPSTAWSLITKAGVPNDEGRRALEEVLTRYLPVLQTYLKRVHRIHPQEAEDLLQSFLADNFLKNELVTKADRTQGRFRSLLITSLDRFLVSRVRYDYAQKRDRRLNVNVENAFDVQGREPEAKDIIEIEWARATVAETLRRMRLECEVSNRQDVWGIFNARLLSSIFGGTATPYSALSVEYGLTSPNQAANLLITAKRMFARSLRAVIAEYVPDQSSVEEEITELRNILRNAGGE